MRINVILRLILALVSATLAAIFTQLIPGLSENLLIIRVLVTLLAALTGFLIFPKIAKKISDTTVKFFNILVRRVSLEMSYQMNKISKPSFPFGQKSSRSIPQSGIILDTSAVIDGRILDIAKTGFIFGALIIPKFVLIELQLVADSSDSIKRGRGRRGFETIESLKKTKEVSVHILDKEVKGKNVDEKLLNLAKSLKARLITTDYNLNRVASASNLQVLNINDLSNALKTVVIPGEKLKIKIIHKGKDDNQGVGYLEDSTMVIVAGGAKYVDKTVSIEITKSLQSPTGRIIFGRLS